MFAVATLCSLLVHLPTAIKAADDGSLRVYVDLHWGEPDWDQSVAKQQLDYLKSLHDANAHFGRLMFASLAAQVAAVLATSVLAIRIIQHT